ncbi:hypothetical protein [Alcanivorax sp. DP30]|uniref:hypothetical protein n=1 Tax=Alcanivorax sp. DP30 TaxID=2606217 RepID=UPI001F302D5B|nr:hypothetical protein [Alcanivorax sp. DP30]
MKFCNPVHRLAKLLSGFSIQHRNTGETLLIAGVDSALLIYSTIKAVTTWLDRGAARNLSPHLEVELSPATTVDHYR